MFDLTYSIFGQRERISALVTPFVIKFQTALNDASSWFVCEGSIALIAFISLGVVDASWILLDTFFMFLGIIVSIHALDTCSIFIHLLTEFVFGYAYTIASEDVIWVALQTFTIFADQTIRYFASIVQKMISCLTTLASTDEVFQASIDLATFKLWIVDKWRATTGASTTNIIASEFTRSALVLVVELVTLFAFEADVVAVASQTIRIRGDALAFT